MSGQVSLSNEIMIQWGYQVYWGFDTMPYLHLLNNVGVSIALEFSEDELLSSL
jgi:hypothetical protein